MPLKQNEPASPCVNDAGSAASLHSAIVQEYDRHKAGHTVDLPLASIHLDFQPRENLIEETVQKYMALLRRGEKLPPLEVRFDGKDCFSRTGFTAWRLREEYREGTGLFLFRKPGAKVWTLQIRGGAARGWA